MNEYRNEHDIRVKLGNEKGRAARGGGNYDDNTAFGRPTRPSTAVRRPRLARQMARTG